MKAASPSSHVPVRSCLGCGKKRPKAELIRLAVDELGRVVPDDGGQMRGRGGYSCRTDSCLAKICKKVKRLKRAWRRDSLVVDFETLRRGLESGSGPLE